MSKTCLIGGGLTGLVRAWRSQQSGREVTLLEASENVGGVLQSRREAGYLLDYGANTLSLRSREVSKLLDEIGVLEKVIDANPKSNLRFIVRGGQLISLPHSPASFLCSSFLSPLGKIRLLLEPLVPRGKNQDENVANFIPEDWEKKPLLTQATPFFPEFMQPSQRVFLSNTPSLPCRNLSKLMAPYLKGCSNQKKIPTASRRADYFPFPMECRN